MKKNLNLKAWLAKKLTKGLNSQTKDKLFNYKWVVLIACLIIMSVTAGIRLSFGVFFQSLEGDFGWTRAVTSGIFSLSSLLVCVFAIIGGWVLDRYGPRIVYTTMGVCTALGLLLTSYASTLFSLYLSFSLLLAMGTGPSYVVIVPTISKWFSKNRGLALGIVTAGVGLGTTIFTPLSTYLIASYGWRVAYQILSLTALLFIIPAAWVARNPSDRGETLPPEGQIFSNKAPGTITVSEKPKDYSITQAVKTKSFWFFTLIWFFFAYCSFMVLAHIVRHGIDLKLTPTEAGFALSIIGGASIISRLIVGRVSDSIGHKRAAIICALCQAASILFFIEVPSLWFFYASAVFFGFAWGGISPPLAALIGEIFGFRNLGTVLGFAEIGFALGSALGISAAGYLFDMTGSYTLAFISGSVAMCSVAIIICFINKEQRRKT